MNWKVIWQSLKTKEMRKRILAVLGMLLVFRVLTYVPIPLANAHTLKALINALLTSENTPQLVSFLNVLSGGALANFSIMLVGLGPYINASIIMQLLTRAIPKLEALNKEGEFGRKKINQYTRILTFPLAIIQSIGAIYLVKQTAAQLGNVGNITANTSIIQWIVMVAALTGGSMLLMWLGELITERSIGNGISLLITVGIVSRLPQAISTIANALVKNTGKLIILGHKTPIVKQAILFYVLVVLVILIITVFIVKLNEAKKNLTINYAKRVQGNRTYGGVTTTLPIKLIAAGVIPIIFAVAFLSVPSFVGQILSGSHSAHLADIGSKLVTWFQSPSGATFAKGGWVPYIYPVTYFSLVFVFTFFYTGITFNAKEIAENLQKQGGFLEGVRAGAQTEKFLSKIVNRLTLFGALCLGMLALLPIIGQIFINANITIGGTSLLILVTVSLETLRAIESRALMVTYDQYEQPDFFYDADNALLASTGASRLRFIPRRRKIKQ
ncbi:MAG TPA: preprotein translocase subunit SecY [Candidatus Saccharimonadales bacterium]|nr:preprotein translocase subunit SecY [Candidatus Saccharimonadales bacterium]